MRFASAVAGLVVTAGCSGLQFRPQPPVRIDRPSPFETVTSPVTLRWTERQSLPAGGQFAVFLDRPALHPGASLRDIPGPECRRQPGCPDANVLEQHGVYLTKVPILSISALPLLKGAAARGDRQLHTARIVIVDATGRRVGEGVSTVDFLVVRAPP